MAIVGVAVIGLGLVWWERRRRTAVQPGKGRATSSTPSSQGPGPYTAMYPNRQYGARSADADGAAVGEANLIYAAAAGHRDSLDQNMVYGTRPGRPRGAADAAPSSVVEDDTQV